MWRPLKWEEWRRLSRADREEYLYLFGEGVKNHHPPVQVWSIVFLWMSSALFLLTLYLGLNDPQLSAVIGPNIDGLVQGYLLLPSVIAAAWTGMLFAWLAAVLRAWWLERRWVWSKLGGAPRWLGKWRA